MYSQLQTESRILMLSPFLYPPPSILSPHSFPAGFFACYPRARVDDLEWQDAGLSQIMYKVYTASRSGSFDREAAFWNNLKNKPLNFQLSEKNP